MRDPWRQVVHISEGTGPRGGEYWSLILECGHHAAKRRPRLGMPAALGRSLAATCAPGRMRCLFCGMGCDPHPETIAAEVAALEELGHD